MKPRPRPRALTRPAPRRRATGPRALARPRRAAKRPRPAARKKRWRVLLVLLLASLAVWWLWPSSEAPPEPEAIVAEKSQPKEHERKEPEKKEPEKKPAAKKPPPPKVAAVKVAPKTYVPDREKLLEAIRERSRELADCSLPPGSPPLLPARLRISKSGEIRSLRFAVSAPLPEPLATCARSKIAAWKFTGLDLQSDVETLVSFELGNR